jgi:hypothetical protein
MISAIDSRPKGNVRLTRYPEFETKEHDYHLWRAASPAWRKTFYLFAPLARIEQLHMHLLPQLSRLSPGFREVCLLEHLCTLPAASPKHDPW